MKAKHIADFNARAAEIVAYVLKTHGFTGNVLNLQSDNTLDPGASPVEGARYVIQTSGSLHANFGTINEKFTGYDQNGNKTFSAVVLGDDDIVESMAAANSGSGAFVVVYDVSVEAKDAAVLNQADNHIYKFNPDTPAWTDEGSAFEPGFTETEKKYSPASDVAANTEHEIVLDNASKAGFVPDVSIEGVQLKSVDTTQSGVEGYSHVAGTTSLKIRVPYTILTSETVRINYKY